MKTSGSYRMAPISEEEDSSVESKTMEEEMFGDDAGAFPSSSKSRRHCFTLVEENEEEEVEEPAYHRLPSLASTCESGNSTSITSSEDYYSAKEEEEEELEELPKLREEPTTTPQNKNKKIGDSESVPSQVLSPNTSEEADDETSLLPQKESKKRSLDLVKSLQALAKLQPEIPELILLEGAGNHAELETLVSKLTLPEELLKVKRKGWLEDADTIPPATSDLSGSSSDCSGEIVQEETDRVRGMQLFVQMGRTTHAGWYSGRINGQKQAHGNGIIKFDDDEAGVDGMIMYMGEFSEGHMHGQGTLVLRGDTLRGEFEYNLYVC